MHVLFLTDNFPPEVNAPASRTFEHCREWVRKGERVTVITCAPNFPGGKVFPGYRNRLFGVEEMDGVRVIRVWSYITANEGFLRRTLDYASFMVSAFAASLFVRRVDVVVGTSPQFFTACAAWATAAVKRVPFVFELRDLWPESIKAVGAMSDSALLRLLEGVELFLYRRASLIVSVTRSFPRVLAARGIDPAKIQVVTNGVDLSRFFPRPRDEALERELGLAGKFVSGYIGTHGMAHGLDTLLDAAALLQNRGEHAHRLLLLGAGAEKRRLVGRAKEMGLRNVLFLDPVAKEQIARYWSLLDLSIIHLRDTPLFATVLPSKIFESMGMGIPILLGVKGEAAELVASHGCGVVFPPDDAGALAEALVRLAADTAGRAAMSRRGTEASHGFDRAALAERMRGMLSELVILGKGKQR